MEYQCSSKYCSISISAHECYNFIFKVSIDQVILYSLMCITKCNITALIFLRALNVREGFISTLFQCKHNNPSLKKKECNQINIQFLKLVFFHIRVKTLRRTLSDQTINNILIFDFSDFSPGHKGTDPFNLRWHKASLSEEDSSLFK